MQDTHGFRRPELTVDSSGDSVRYLLPRRQLGRVKNFGWALMGMGGFVTLFMVGWMWMPISNGIEELQQQNQAGWMSIAFGGMGIFGLVPAFCLLMAGSAIVSNRTRCVVELRHGVLRTRETFFLARWQRRRQGKAIDRLRVSLASEWKSDDDEQDVGAWLGDWEAALVAEMSDGNQFLVAVAYPRELLLDLASNLAARLELATMTSSALVDRDPAGVTEGRAPKKVEVFEGPPVEPAECPIPDQPAGSTATIERRPYGITIDVPPVGIWKGSRGLMFFTIVWNGFVGLFVTFLVLAMTGAIEVEGEKPGWHILLFMVPFVGAGVGTGLTAINMGLRRATIATADNMVMIVRQSIFGKSTKEWSAEDIDEIRMGNSGMEVNNVPIKELQIRDRDGNKFGCLSQLEEDELAWIAGELNQALILAPESKSGVGEHIERDESGRAVPPPRSRMTVNQGVSSTQITVPPLGLWKNLPGLIFGTIFMSVGGGIALVFVKQISNNGIDGSEWIMIAFVSLFVVVFGGVGALTFFMCWLSVARRFHVVADGLQLTVVRRGFVLRKTFRWERGLLNPVEVNSSGMKTNNRAHYHISISSRNGSPLWIMSGYDRSDLEFVAAAINETLALTEP